MQEKTDALSSLANKIGLEINKDKTKIMKIPINQNGKIHIEGTDVEEVSHFAYLGSYIDQDGDTRKEVRIRIAKAASIFKNLENIWDSKVISTKTKLRLFNSNVMSTLTYACESWKSTKEIDKKLDSFENKCLRKILCIKWNEFKRNTEIRQMSKQQPVSEVIKKRRWTYVGHVMRRNDHRIPKQAIKWNLTGRRKRGRPRETLRRTLIREGKLLGIGSLDEVERLAEDRNSWRTKLRALCDVNGTGRI